MKLGPVKTGQGDSDYLKCSIPDSLSYLLSGCLTVSDPFPKFPMASRIILDNSLHVSSALYASGPREIK